MQSQEFKIKIQAPRESVWDVLWDDDTFPQWAAAFSEGSYAETDWKEGSEVRFLGPSKNGMLSKIVKCTHPEHMSIEHIGVLYDGKVETNDDEANKWIGARESYRLSSSGDDTELHVEVDLAEDYSKSFGKAWPKALEKVKALAEDNAK